MQTTHLLTDLKFNQRDTHARAQAVHADHDGRALRWTLLPGQNVPPSSSPHSPVYLIILKGSGYFAGADGVEQKLGLNEMAVFARGEEHRARAEDEELVFIAILQGAPNPDHNH